MTLADAQESRKALLAQARAARRGSLIEHADGAAPHIASVAKKLSPARFRLLPITMMMLVLFLGVKMHAVYLNGMELQGMLYGSAQAAEEAGKDSKDGKEDEGKSADAGQNAGPTESPPSEAIDAASEENPEGKGDSKDASADGKEGKDKKPASPEDVKLASLEKEMKEGSGRQFSQIELDILQNLSRRRQDLDKQAQELDMKEKLLEATELRVNDKLDEMKGLKGQVEKLLEEYNTQEDNKLRGLVKIYENMKAKDAAQIFNELDMQILLEVVDRMSERKVAPVLAGMAPMKAKELTEQLAEYRRLRPVPTTLGK